MVTINAVNNYPKKVVLIYVVPFFISIFIFSIAFGKYWLILLFLLSLYIGLPYYFYYLIQIKNCSFILSENAITKNYGVRNKKSVTITFDKIQNITCSSSPLFEMLNFTRLSIWTASPSQTIVYKGTSQNAPSILLTLDSKDADWIKNYILNKNNQPTQPVTENHTSINNDNI